MGRSVARNPGPFRSRGGYIVVAGGGSLSRGTAVRNPGMIYTHTQPVHPSDHPSPRPVLEVARFLSSDKRRIGGNWAFPDDPPPICARVGVIPCLSTERVTYNRILNVAIALASLLHHYALPHCRSGQREAKSRVNRSSSHITVEYRRRQDIAAADLFYCWMDKDFPKKYNN